MCREALPDGWIDEGHGLARQPDRQVRHRRSRRRLRPHRPQDHRRHLWRRRAAWRRRLLRQGPDQGRPLGRLRRALPRQERGRRRPRRPLHHPALLRHRRRPAAVDLCRPARHRARSTRRKLERALAIEVDGPDAARHPRASRPQQADLCPHLRLWPFRPRARTPTAASAGKRPTSSTRCAQQLR